MQRNGCERSLAVRLEKPTVLRGLVRISCPRSSLRIELLVRTLVRILVRILLRVLLQILH